MLRSSAPHANVPPLVTALACRAAFQIEGIAYALAGLGSGRQANQLRWQASSSAAPSWSFLAPLLAAIASALAGALAASTFSSAATALAVLVVVCDLPDPRCGLLVQRSLDSTTRPSWLRPLCQERLDLPGIQRLE